MIDITTLRESVRGKKVLIDSNIIIYLTEETEPYYRLSWELFSIHKTCSKMDFDQKSFPLSRFVSYPIKVDKIKRFSRDELHER